MCRRLTIVNVGSAAYDLGLKPVSDVFLSSPIAELSKKYLGWNWSSHSVVFDDVYEKSDLLLRDNSKPPLDS